MFIARLLRRVGGGLVSVGIVAMGASAQMDPRGALIRVPPEMNLGQVAVGTIATREHVFASPHNERVTINTVGSDDRVTFHGQDPPHPARAVFGIVDLVLPTTLGPGGQFRFSIRFSPPAAQTYRPGNPLTMCVTTETTDEVRPSSGTTGTTNDETAGVSP